MSETEIVKTSAEKLDELNQKTRLQGADLLSSIDILPAGSPLEEVKKIYNVFNLPSSGRPFKAEKEFGLVNGGGTIINSDKVSDITKYTTVNGVTFAGTEKAQDTRLAIVREGARGVFTGCTFRRPSKGVGATMVEIEAGATAIFVGCQFHRGTFPILNSAGAGDVIVIGCSQGDLGTAYNDPAGAAVTVIGSLS